MPKKKYEVIKATTRDIPGLYVGGRKRQFAANGMFSVSDAGEAKEIDKVLGAKGTGEVVVTSYNEKEHGHNYTFGASKRFADAWDAFQKRRKDKAIHKPKRQRGRSAKPAGVRNARGTQENT